jgi:hypothetical protein
MHIIRSSEPQSCTKHCDVSWSQHCQACNGRLLDAAPPRASGRWSHRWAAQKRRSVSYSWCNEEKVRQKRHLGSVRHPPPFLLLRSMGQGRPGPITARMSFFASRSPQPACLAISRAVLQDQYFYIVYISSYLYVIYKSCLVLYRTTTGEGL